MFFCIYVIILFSLVDPKDKARTEPRLKSYAAAYKKLTGANASFEFPVAELE